MHYLLITGSMCITIALLEAWCMVSVRFLNIEAIKSRVVGYGFMVKSHLDYLLMSCLLFSIYSVLAHLEVELAPVIVICMCIGALLNPFGFLVAAFRTQPSKVMTYVTYTSFTLTTLGFMGAVITIVVSIV
jgi:hypothetical protein